MTEILTESFCERCGTRYTFESAGPRRSRVGRVRTLSRGLRNYVMSDGTTFSEALADARSEDEISATAHQLDAFHRTFNFCLTCRQYTCGNCWNDVDGRCLTCAPVPGMELPEPASMVAVAEPPAPIALVDEAGPQAWPEADLSAVRMGIVPGVVAPQIEVGVEAPAEAEAALGPVAALEPEAVTQDLSDQEPAAEAAALAEAVTVAEAGAVAEADLEPTPLAGPEVAAEAAAPVSFTVDEPEPTPEPSPEVEPEPVVAELEHAPAEPVALTPVDEGRVAVEPIEAARALGVAPGQSVEEAVAAYEALLAAEEAAGLVATEPVTAAGTEPTVSEPEPVTAAEPLSIVMPAEPRDVSAAEDVAAEVVAAAVGEITTAEPAAEPETIPVAAATDESAAPVRDDVVVQPTWPVQSPTTPIAAPAAPPAPPSPTPVSPWLTVAPDDGTRPEPQWPQVPIQGRFGPNAGASQPAIGTIAQHGDPAALWAASAREVMSGGPRPAQPTVASTPTPQPCISCGLPLSASARFCRRCGSRQG